MPNKPDKMFFTEGFACYLTKEIDNMFLVSLIKIITGPTEIKLD